MTTDSGIPVKPVYTPADLSSADPELPGEYPYTRGIQPDVFKQGRHVFEGIDGHAGLADFAFGQRMIAVVADLRGQVEGDAESHDPLAEQIMIAGIAFLGGAETRILPHRP